MVQNDFELKNFGFVDARDIDSDTEGERFRGAYAVRFPCDDYAGQTYKDEEYGIERREDGGHCGGPFRLKVSPKCTVRDLHLLIRDAAGIMPGLQKLAYRGVALDAPYRRLEQYGVAHWHAKFPDWPVVVKQ